MNDVFVKEGFKGADATYEFPLRDVNLIKFYKTIKSEHNIFAIYFDEENKRISFLCSNEQKREKLDGEINE